MGERVVAGTGSSPLTMVRAALPAIPVINLLPGIGKHGDALPDLVLRRTDVAIERDHLRAYAEVCGFEPTQSVPLTYPHMLAFGLYMAIMTDRSFPYPAIGTIHLGNTITQHRRLDPSERLDVAATADNLRDHPKGRVFDLVTTIRSGGEVVWESTSNYLRIGDAHPEAAIDHEPPEVVPPSGIVWDLPADLGRRYAAVSGDHNPIHLYALTARALGFRRQIAHGMWSKARCVAMLANRLPDQVRVHVDFKKPAFLPTKVGFGSRPTADGHAFSLVDHNTGAPHLVGRTSLLR